MPTLRPFILALGAIAGLGQTGQAGKRQVGLCGNAEGGRTFSIQTINHDLPGSLVLARIDSLVVEIGKR